MKIVHSIAGRSAQATIPDHPVFFIGDKRGTFFSQSTKSNTSQYQGLVTIEPSSTTEWSMMKSVESIALAEHAEEIVNHYTHIDVKRTKARERFFVTDHGLIYDVHNYTGDVQVFLDMRKQYDFSDQGRIYTLTHHDEFIVVKYEKFTDHSLTKLDYTHWLAIKTDNAMVEEPQQWVYREYPYDRRRNAQCQFHIFHAANIHVAGQTKLIFATGNTEQEAMMRAHLIGENEEYLRRQKKISLQNVQNRTPPLPEAHIYQAFVAAIQSLDVLNVHLLWQDKMIKGVLAGMPWFHQFWSRDELISMKALMLDKKYSFVKDRLMWYAHHITDDGRLPNRIPFSTLSSADSIGWLWKRVDDFITILEEDKVLHQYFMMNELAFLRDRCEQSVLAIKKHHMQDGFVMNERKETWMDTDNRGDTRAGACIEIQALTLASYATLERLCKIVGKKYNGFSEEQKQLLEKTRATFFDGSILKDKSNDATQRPNIFLAGYIYPLLLKKKEWESVYRRALDALWMPWGGIASIDQQDGRFHAWHSGENNDSYHRGDVWYFTNSIAALACQYTNKKLFKKEINAIVESQTKDILTMGYIGHASEISSAQEQEAVGSPVQAWSAALFCELIAELFYKA